MSSWTHVFAGLLPTVVMLVGYMKLLGKSQRLMEHHVETSRAFATAAEAAQKRTERALALAEFAERESRRARTACPRPRRPARAAHLPRGPAGAEVRGVRRGLTPHCPDRAHVGGTVR